MIPSKSRIWVTAGSCQGEGEGPSGWKEGSFIANILFIFMVDLIEKHTVVVEE